MKITFKISQLLFVPRYFILLLSLSYLTGNAQNISNTRVNSLNNNIHFCLGGTYTVTFDTTGTTGSIFTVQLSDASGSFITNTNLDSSASKSISVVIPTSSTLSNNYKLRVVRRAGPTIIGDTLSNLTITIPTSNFSFTNNLCAGSNANFTNTSTGNGVGISNYSWNFSATAGAPSSPNTNSSPTVSFNPANGSGTEIYNVILTATDSFGCTNTANQNISVRKLPATSFTFNNNVCASSSVNFNNTSNGNGPLSCVWNFGATTGAPSNNTNFSPSVIFNAGYGANPITYNTTLTVTDVYGCSNSSIQNVTVNQVPDARTYAALVTGNFTNVPNNGGNPDTIRKCNNTLPFQLTLANSSSSIAGNSNYIFEWGDLTSNTSSTGFGSYVTHTYSSQGEYPFKLTVSNGLGCTTTKSIYIYIGTNPSIGLGNPGSTTGECISRTYVFPITSFATNSPGTRYDITSNDGAFDTSYSHPPPAIYTKTYFKNSCGYTSLGNYQNSFHVRIKAINACASSAATVEPIQLSSKPKANFGYNNPSCVNTNVIFTNTSGNGRFVDPSPPNQCDTSSFPEWEITPSTGWTLISGVLDPVPTATNTITVNFNLPGVYTVKLRIKSTAYIIDPSYSCGVDSITKTICIEPPPIPNFQLSLNPSTGCVNNIISPINTSNTLLSCGSPVYVWSVWDSLTSLEIKPAARFSYLSGTDSSSVNPIFSFSQKGRYKIRLKIVNKCAGTFVKDTFIIIKDKPLVSLPNNINYCDSQTITFNLGSVNHKPIYDSSYGTISSYNWKIIPNTGFTYTSGDSTSKYPTIKFINYTTNPITYKVILSATNECGVSIPDTQNITINPRPQASASAIPSKMAFCSGDTTNIVLSNNLSSVVRYTWRAYGSSSKISGFSNQTAGVTGPIIQTLINTGNVNETVLYRIVAKDTLTGCLGDSTNIIITVYPIPKVNASSQNICSGTQTNIALSSNVSGTLFTWTASARGSTTGFRDTSNAVGGPIINTLVNNSSIRDTVIYAIRATSNGCVSLDTLIRVIVYPIPLSSGGFANICSNDTAKYTATSLVAGTTYTFTASLINGNAIGFSNGNGSINQKLTNTGNTDALVRYTITPTGPLPTLCPGQPVNFDVTIKPKPILTVTSSSSICSGSQTNISLNSSVTNTFYKYTATLISGTNTSGFYNKLTDTLSPIAQVISNTGGANSLVRYTIIPTANLCKGDTQYHDVTIFPGVNAGSITAPATVCAGTNTGTLNLTGNTGAVVRWEQSVSPFTSWTIINNLNSTQNYSNLIQTTWYRAVIQSGGFCPTVNTSPLVITVDSPSIAGNLSGTDTVCTGTNNGSIQLINYRGAIINWDNSISLPTWNSISGTTNLSSYNYVNLNQTTWFRVEVKNGVCPLSISDSVRIQVDAQPSQAIAADKAICANSLTIGTNDNITANPISTGIGLWTYLSGPNTPIIVSPNTSTSAINNLAIGTHYILWQVSNGKCPSSKDTLNLVVYPPIQSSISDSQVICSGQAPSTLIGTIPTGGNGVYNYQWQSSADGIIWVDIIAATSKNYQPSTLTSSTWYSRKVVSNVCNQISNIVFVQVLPSITNNTITPNAAICIGGSSPIIVGSSPNGGNSIYTYKWQKYDGNIWENLTTADTLKDYNPGILLNTTVFRRIVSSSFCNGLQASISNTDTIIINPLPIVNAGNDSSKCQNQTTYNLNGSPSGGTWSGIGVVSNTFNPSAMPLGSYTLIYTYTNINGCTNKDTSKIDVIATPIVEAGNSFSICENTGSVQLSGFSPVGGTWSGVGVSASGLFNPTIAGSGSFYLKYLFTAGTGCQGIDSLLVTVNPRPNGNFTLANQICPNGSISLTVNVNNIANVNGFAWTISNNGALSNSILSSYNNANTTINFPENKSNADVTYNIKLNTITDFGCIDSNNHSITLRRRPFAQFSTGSNINCGAATYNLVNGTSNIPIAALSYLWMANPNTSVIINTNTSRNPQLILPVNNTGLSIPYNISLIVTRNDGTLSCSDTANNSLTIYPKPTISFTALPNDSGCSPLHVNFSNSSNPQNSESISTMNFLWNFGTYGTDTTRNPQKTFTNSGVIDSTINVKLIGTSKWGCADSVTKLIKVYPFPKADFQSSIYSSCAPFVLNSSIITLTQYPIANSNYVWRIIDKSGTLLNTYFGTTIPSYSITNPNDTIYYQLIASHNRGCKPDTLTRMFRTISNPKPSFSLIDSIGCSPLTVTFNNTSAVGVTSNWTFSNGANPTLTNPFQVIFSNNSNTINKVDTVMLVITAGTGCKDSLSKLITIYPKPKAVFNLASSICSDTNKIITSASIFKAPSASYLWQFVGNTNNVINNPTLVNPTFTFINNQNGIDSIYNIKLRVTSVDGCVHDTTQSVTILKRPLANFTIPQTLCGPSSVVLTNNTSNVNSVWSSNPSLGFTTNTSQNPIVSFPINTTNDSVNYRIILTATRIASTCVDTTSRLVTIYPKPLASFTVATQDSCGPRIVKFTNTSSAKNGESLGTMSYLWTILNNTFSTTNANSTFTNTGIIDSSYNARLIVTSIHGCKDTANNLVKVYPNAKAIFNFTSNTACAPFIINASNVIAVDYPNANNLYNWYRNDTLIGTGLNFPTQTISRANDSILIKLVTTSLKGCKNDSMQVWFRTIPNPKPNFTAIDSLGCTPLSVSFINTSTVGVTSNWTFSNGFVPSNPNNFNTTFNNFLNTRDTIYTAKLVITAGSGCKDSLIKNIIVYPKPKAIFSLPNITCSDTIKTASNSTVYKPSSISYLWKFLTNTSNSINNTSIASPTFTFNNNQTGSDSTYTIQLIATSIDGCKHDTTQSVTILKRPLANFTIPQTLCGPSSAVISNNTNNVNSVWSSNPSLGFTTSTSQNPIVFFPLNNTNDSINYRIILTATRVASSCVDTTSRLATIYPKPLASFLVTTQDSCGPRIVKFTNTSSAKNGESLGTMSYLWIILNNTFSTSNANSTFTNTGIIDSSYNARLIVTSMHGCKDTTNNIVKVYPNAKALFNFTTSTACAPFIINSANVTAVDFPNANDTYKWYKNGNLIGTGLVFPTQTISNPNDSILIKLIAHSLNNCKNDSMEVWFRTIPNPKPNYTAIDSIGCTPLVVNFNNTSNPISGVGFRWEFGNNLNISYLTNPKYTFYNYGITDTIEFVKLIITASGTGCMDSIVKPIIVKPLPRPIISLVDSVLCYPNIGTATNISLNTPPIDNLNIKWKIFGQDIATISNDTSSISTSIRFPDNKTGLNKIYLLRLFVKSNFGCLDSAQKAIRVPTRPIANYNFQIDSSCAPITLSTNNSSSYGSNYVWSSIKPNVNLLTPTSFNTNLNFPSHTGTIDSIYPIKLIAKTFEGCYDTIIKPFKVFPLPIAGFNLDIDSGCSPLKIRIKNLTIAKKPTNNFWDFGDGSKQIINSDSFDRTFVGSIFNDTTYTIKLISSSKDGCKDSTTKIIKVKSGAYSKIHLADSIFCSNTINPAKLKIDNKSYGSVDTFYWDFGDGTQLITNKDTSINHPYNIEGIYTIRLKATNNCKTSYDSSQIKVLVPPSINFSKSDSVGCSPLNVTFSNNSTNLYEAKYLWNFGNGVTSILKNPPTITFLQSRTVDTTYLITLQISNACYKGSIIDSIKVHPKPVVDFSLSADSICSGSNIFVINKTVGLPDYLKWQFGNGDSSNRYDPLQNPIRYFSIDSTSNFRIKLFASNTCGSDSLTRVLKVLPNNVKSLFKSSGNFICVGDTVFFQNSSKSGNYFSWDFGDGSGLASQFNATHVFLKAGNFLTRLNVNDGCGFDTSSIEIKVNPIPQFSISKSNTQICVNNPIQFYASLQDSGTIIWHFGDGDSSIYRNPSHAYKTYGMKKIKAVLTSANSICSNIKYDSVYVNPLPIINISSDSNKACAYHIFNLTASSTDANVFSWDLGDSNSSSGAFVKHLYSQGGNYIIKVVAQTSSNCVDTAYKSIVVYPVPTANFDYTPKDTCSGPVLVHFTNKSTGANNFSWTFGNGNLSTYNNPETFYSGVGAYPIELICSNQFSCYDTLHAIYNVYQMPKAALDFDVNSGCPQLKVQFTNKSQFGTHYTWYFGDGELDTTLNPMHTYVKSGIYDVKLVASNNGVCVDSISSKQKIVVFNKPYAPFNMNLQRDKKPYRIVNFSINIDSIKFYKWNFGDGIFGFEREPTHKYAESDSGWKKITITITNINGCDSSYSDSIYLPGYWNGLYVPNAFTPSLGQDGPNEFKPIGIEIEQGTYNAKVFNKWGELMWENSELTPDGMPARGWDGNDKDGIPCMQGSYIWVIEAVFTDGTPWNGMLLNDGQLHKKGNVTLIR